MVLELAPDKLASGQEKEMPLVVPLPVPGVMVGYVGNSVGLEGVSGSEVIMGPSVFEELGVSFDVDRTADDFRTTVLVSTWVMVE